MTATRISAAKVDELRDLVLPAGTKGLPLDAAGMSLREFGASGLGVLTGQLPMPVAVLDDRQVSANIAAMQNYCDSHAVSLCPHGKTTLAPQIFERQIEAGAWGLTAATPAHLRMYRHYEVDRIFYANQLVEAGPIRWLAGELNDHPEFEFFCVVDSVDAVDILSTHLRAAGAQRPVRVLVEVGHADGRCGVRDREAARGVAAAIDASPSLHLAGVECFEGLSPVVTDEALVDEFLQTTADIAADLALRTSLADTGSIMLTAGGSAYFDRVVEKFRYETHLDARVDVVLRSGCYVTQDGGFYARTSPLQGRGVAGSPLGNALQVWSAILSRPEPDFVVASMGKRDCSYDQTLPTPHQLSVGGGPPAGVVDAETVALSDQHAHVRVPTSFEGAVGDLMGFVVSHPCTTFDKWRVIPLVDDDYRVVDAVVTAF